MPFTSDIDRIAVWKRLTEELNVAAGAGKREITFTIPVLHALDLIAEIMDRHPRNMSRLFRDDIFEQLDVVIARLHEEVNFLISHGPAETVAERFREDRERPSRRAAISPELKALLRRPPE